MWVIYSGRISTVKNETESVKIDKEVLAKCRRIARREGRTLSGLIRVLLMQALSTDRRSNDS
jgi:hypothetical protein